MNTEKQTQHQVDGGKVWFVTGAGKGLGFEIARAALGAGHRVAATVRDRAEEMTTALRDDPRLFVAVMDVTDEAQVRAAVAQAVARFGRIDVLVNNAGYGLLSGIEEATDAEVRRQYDTNVFGLLNVTRAVLPQMRARRSGHVINISSLYGLGSLYGWGVYGSTKFAVEGITEALAAEVAPLGLFATAVEPGLFRTSFLSAKSYAASATPIADYADTVGRMRAAAGQLDGSQPGDPLKLAQALLALAASERPPVHLPLGTDSLAQYRQKTANLEKEIVAWQGVTAGTDYPAASQEGRS